MGCHNGDELERGKHYPTRPDAFCEDRNQEGPCKNRKTRRGEIAESTCVTAPWDEPEIPGLVVDTQRLTLAECVEGTIRHAAERLSYAG